MRLDDEHDDETGTTGQSLVRSCASLARSKPPKRVELLTRFAAFPAVLRILGVLGANESTCS